MKTTHTPGPWEFSAFGKGPQLLTAHAVIKAKNAPRIADVRSVYDARLIAAAPDLLAALEYLVRADEDIQENRGLKSGQAMGRIAALDAAHAAIAKAKGEQ